VTCPDLFPKEKDIPRYTVMPDCEYEPTSRIRIVREVTGLPNGYARDVLEMMYMNGFGMPFWGPVPIVEVKV
jgi:hypothetical protein